MSASHTFDVGALMVMVALAISGFSMILKSPFYSASEYTTGLLFTCGHRETNIPDDFRIHKGSVVR